MSKGKTKLMQVVDNNQTSTKTKQEEIIYGIEKAYYDRACKRIHRIRKTCDVSQAIVCDEIEGALKEELT